ncbi:AraC family transcriptional regulator [Mycolicibacterium mageritense DSM 44476 = CIP 104973]|uniref:AraC family transcriptional regulator n=1 Tax=Mycolicibacterium mageritense TaxID=53462 RepID=A0ABM7I226_MYCME|nr:helix-turn-helix domain-containing protein [Mycolicibacterium mageritense]MCC9183994.1 helix-turn-helix domain-containing protein [Mycolicibacterium mageritense]TXI65563.1 MAG: AraC family transcriptional regulator [Mycolicibacterium mageritense]BBX36944.1 AraC family transcriptional regulator [Mycolicibacterium mageritense]CDO26574.1 AraC family transcriptional regulator [Mycolicibacterium mageritense DSM 44476 = CIP 104973]
MIYTRHQPAAALRRHVDHVWCLTDGPTHPAERILPAGTVEVVVNLRDAAVCVENREGQQRLSGSVVSGPYTSPFDIDARKHTDMIGIHFKIGGALALLGVSPAELADTHVDLGALWGLEADDLREQLCDATSTAYRFRIVESLLLGHLRDDDSVPNHVARAVRTFARGGSQPPVRVLADEAGLSHRRFIALFKVQVGMTPKKFARLCRFRSAHRTLISCRTPELSRIAVEHGYSDQSHMIREFQTFSGLTPTEHLDRCAQATKDDHVALRP